MHRVYSAANVIDAQLLCDLLIETGLSAIVKGGYLSGAAGEIPVDSLISVWVEDERDIARARQLVDDFEAAGDAPAHPRVCTQCGESTTSNFAQCWNCQHPID